MAIPHFAKGKGSTTFAKIMASRLLFHSSKRATGMFLGRNVLQGTGLSPLALRTMSSATSQSPALFISDKRYGKEHTTEEIGGFIKGFQDGKVKDYQMSAWLMAVCLVSSGGRREEGGERREGDFP